LTGDISLDEVVLLLVTVVNCGTPPDDVVHDSVEPDGECILEKIAMILWL